MAVVAPPIVIMPQHANGRGRLSCRCHTLDPASVSGEHLNSPAMPRCPTLSAHRIQHWPFAPAAGEMRIARKQKAVTNRHLRGRREARRRITMHPGKAEKRGQLPLLKCRRSFQQDATCIPTQSGPEGSAARAGRLERMGCRGCFTSRHSASWGYPTA
jgi:hypothetical protein